MVLIAATMVLPPAAAEALQQKMLRAGNAEHVWVSSGPFLKVGHARRRMIQYPETFTSIAAATGCHACAGHDDHMTPTAIRSESRSTAAARWSSWSAASGPGR